MLVMNSVKPKDHDLTNTVGSKIIRALEIIRVKKLIHNIVLRNKYLSSHDL